MTFHMRRASIMRVALPGRRNIWLRWRVSPVAPRIVNGASYAMGINHESHFSWQAQYLVMLQSHFSWQAQYLVKFWVDSRSVKCCSFQYKMRLRSAESKLGARAGPR